MPQVWAWHSRRKFRDRYNEYYVNKLCAHDFKLPFRYRLHAMKPLLIAMMPGFLYKYLHRKKLSKSLPDKE